MDAKLVVVGGEARVTEVDLELPLTVGRGRSSGMALPHPLVSRQHCEIYEEEGKLVVNDLGSLNGTFVGDQRIREPTFLMPGELLTVGTVTFRAVYQVAGEAASGGIQEESTGTEVAAEVEPVEQVEEVEILDDDDDDADETAKQSDSFDVEATLQAAIQKMSASQPSPQAVQDAEAVPVAEGDILDDAQSNSHPLAADHETKEVETSGDTRAAEDEGDDDLSAFLQGLG